MTKISISNIAWEKEADDSMYQFLQENELEGLEVAPTRLFPDDPYENIRGAVQFSKKMKESYGLSISSIQSVWFGRKENIFADSMQRDNLIEYTKKAFAFAHALGCRNVVFGCPKNRVSHAPDDMKIAVEFFKKLGDLAKAEELVFAIEANPAIYGTNFLNTTKEAYAFVKQINSCGIGLNYDLGTVIYQNEDIQTVESMMDKISHIHISEPFLKEVSLSCMHKKLCEILKTCKYKYYISIEMGKCNNLHILHDIVLQLKDLVRNCV